MNSKERIGAVLSLVISLLLPADSGAQGARKVVQVAFPSVVLLSMADGKGQSISLGSGFSVGSELIATNLHVIRGASKGFAKAIGGAGRYDVEGIAAVDEKNDLVVLKVRGYTAPVLQLANSKSVGVGDEVFAVGNPQGLEGTISQGIISAFRQTNEVDLIQITAAISPGSSGGPVLTKDGHVLGIAVGTFRSGQNLNFAIPSEKLKALLARTGTLRPLSSVPPESKKPSAAARPDTKQGVVGALAECRYAGGNPYTNGECRFSIRNHLDRPVERVSGVFIVWDKTGQALASEPFRYLGTVLPGLAVRWDGPSIDNQDMRLIGRAEARILDFRFAD